MITGRNDRINESLTLEEKYPCMPLVINDYEIYGAWLAGNTVSYFQYQKNTLTKNDFQNFCNTTKLKITNYLQQTFNYYCDRDQFEENCRSEINDHIDPIEFYYSDCVLVERNVETVRSTLESTSFESMSNVSIISSAEKLNQLMLIKIDSIPFCDLQIYGLNKPFYDEYNPTKFDFLPKNCKSSLISMLAVMALLSFYIIICNSLVIIIMVKFNDLSKTQNLIKLVLAACDLIIGLFVVPSMFIYTYISYFGTMPWYGFLDCPFQQQHIYSDRIVNMIGFFQMFSICASLYLLMFGSIDRLLAVSKPIQYSMQIYKNFKWWALFLSLLISFVFAVYPTFFPSGDPQAYIDIGLLIVSTGQDSLIAISVILGVPLIIQWINGIIIILIIVNRNKQITRSVGANGKQKRQSKIIKRISANAGYTETSNRSSRISKSLDLAKTNAQLNKQTSLQTGLVGVDLERKDRIRRSMNKLKNSNSKYSEGDEDIIQNISSEERAPVASMQRSQTLNRKQQKSTQEETRAAITLSIMIGAFSLSIIPCLAITIIPLAVPLNELGAGRNISHFDAETYTRFFKLEQIFTVLLMTNAIWNFVVYSLHVKEFRKSFKILFGPVISRIRKIVCCDCSSGGRFEGKDPTTTRARNLPRESNATIAFELGN